MDELKKKLLALDPKQKFIVTAGGGILVAVLYLILPQVSVLGFASVMGIKCFTPDSSLLLIMSLAIVILPIVSACMINAKKVVTPLFAYITTGVFLLFGILLGTTFLSLAFGWWLTLIVAIAWCVVCALLKGEEAKM